MRMGPLSHLTVLLSAKRGPMYNSLVGICANKYPFQNASMVQSHIYLLVNENGSSFALNSFNGSLKTDPYPNLVKYSPDVLKKQKFEILLIRTKHVL